MRYRKEESNRSIADFFSRLSRGFCTFYEKESGSRTVFIEYLNIKNLDLKKLKTISILFLPGNQISDIAVLSLLTNIQYLNLAGNQITDLTPLQELKNLDHLELQDNQISDITPLRDLPGLKYLDLSYNPINDSRTLEELKRKLGGNLII
jgi:Leucine-rich repeat (LRR) protein